MPTTPEPTSVRDKQMEDTSKEQDGNTRKRKMDEQECAQDQEQSAIPPKRRALDSHASSESSQTSNLEDFITPFSTVSRSILNELTHLDLSGQVEFKGTKVVSIGAYGDICKGTLETQGRGRRNIAIKRVRVCLQEDIKIVSTSKLLSISLLRASSQLVEQEIYVWSKLRHPNIHSLLGFALDPVTGFPLLISKWMENGSAWMYVNSNPHCNVFKLVRLHIHHM